VIKIKVGQKNHSSQFDAISEEIFFKFGKNQKGSDPYQKYKFEKKKIFLKSLKNV
jgi:hypothetical protein